MGTRRQQQIRILKTLEKNGWRRDSVERDIGGWVDEMWSLHTLWPPMRAKAWLAFVVDLEWRGSRAPGESVCAVVADTVRRKERTGWLVEIPLGRRWERSLHELIDALQAARVAISPSAGAGKKPAELAPKTVGRIKTRWKHLR